MADDSRSGTPGQLVGRTVEVQLAEIFEILENFQNLGLPNTEHAALGD